MMRLQAIKIIRTKLFRVVKTVQPLSGRRLSRLPVCVWFAWTPQERREFEILQSGRDRHEDVLGINLRSFVSLLLFSSRLIWDLDKTKKIDSFSAVPVTQFQVAITDWRHTFSFSGNRRGKKHVQCSSFFASPPPLLMVVNDSPAEIRWITDLTNTHHSRNKTNRSYEHYEENILT